MEWRGRRDGLILGVHWEGSLVNLWILGLSRPMKWSSPEDDTDLASSLYIFWYTHADTRTSICIWTQQKKKIVSYFLCTPQSGALVKKKHPFELQLQLKWLAWCFSASRHTMGMPSKEFTWYLCFCLEFCDNLSVEMHVRSTSNSRVPPPSYFVCLPYCGSFSRLLPFRLLRKLKHQGWYRVDLC